MVTWIIPSTAVVALAGVSQGAFDSAMYSSTNPALFGTQVAQLDVTPGNYNFPFGGSFTNSGFVNEFESIVLDRTELSTRVYQVNTQTTLTQGSSSLTLNPNDLVFAYTIRLVEASPNTVITMNEFQVGLLNFAAGPRMDGSAILGRAVVGPGPGVASPIGGQSSDLSVVGPFGASHDWQWNLDTASMQLQNSQTITLLMFSSPRPWAQGLGNFYAPSGQGPGFQPSAEGAPVLIPIVPTPGVGALGAVALLFGAARRRR